MSSIMPLLLRLIRLEYGRGPAHFHGLARAAAAMGLVIRHASEVAPSLAEAGALEELASIAEDLHKRAYGPCAEEGGILFFLLLE